MLLELLFVGVFLVVINCLGFEMDFLGLFKGMCQSWDGRFVLKFVFKKKKKKKKHFLTLISIHFSKQTKNQDVKGLTGWAGSWLGTRRSYRTEDFSAAARVVEHHALDGVVMIGGWEGYLCMLEINNSRSMFKGLVFFFFFFFFFFDVLLILLIF